ncbi:MAG: hypothetical protein ACI93R_002612 [Flavobacteriales bacterium]|jgi:hypothetical protein
MMRSCTLAELGCRGEGLDKAKNLARYRGQSQGGSISVAEFLTVANVNFRQPKSGWHL